MSQPSHRRRTTRWLVPTILAAVFGLAMVVFAYRSALCFERARAHFEAGRFEQARASLESWPGLRLRSERVRRSAYALGAKIAMALRQPAEAGQWLSRFPADAPEMVDTALEASLKAIAQGRLKDAESLLRFCLERGDPPSGKVARQLAELYWLECRFEEAEPLYPLMFDGSTPPLAVLQNAMANDARALRPDRQRASLEKLLALAPGEDRVTLGLARLDLLTGDTGAARARLDSLGDRADRPAWLARRDLAITTRDFEELGRALDAAGIPADDIAWIARLHAIAGRPPEPETRTRFAAFAAERGTSADLELAAEFSAAAGDPDTAKRLRNLKRQRDEAFESYRRALQTITSARDRARIEELVGLAAQAARPLDAEVLRHLAAEPETRAVPSLSSRSGIDPFAQPVEKTVARQEPSAWASRVVSIRGAGLSPTNLKKDPTGREAGDPAAPDPVFEDVTAASGIDFVYESGKSLIRQLPETMGGGVAILDYDEDGHPDIYAVQGGPFGNPEPADRPGDRLFRNQGDGTFEDVTRRAGLPEKSAGYGFGVTVADFDADGRTDLFVTRWRKVNLLRNRGDGSFEDVTAKMGLTEGWHWPTSAAFADLDGDGDLDLYVCQYLDWNERDPRICRDGPAGRYVACDPLLLEALPDRVFLNEGDRFAELKGFAGQDDPPGRGLGVVAADFDGDRRIDLFVANDKSANKLYLNRGASRFEETALTAGVAANSEGGFQAGMGTDAGDLDGDGHPDIVVTNFFGEGTSAFRNLGGGQFAENGKPWGITAPSRFLLGFGVALADLNCDGLLDYVSANGHVNDLPDIRQAMPMQVLVGHAAGGFRKTNVRMGDPLARESIGRALATGDLDSDGRVDLVTVSLDGPLKILRNVTPGEGVDRVTIRLAGRRPNRDGIGARLRFSTAGGRSIYRFVNGGGSYQSASDALVHAAVRADRLSKVHVEWPSGRVSELNLDPERKSGTIEIEEP